jgi:hypothetical protein
METFSAIKHLWKGKSMERQTKYWQTIVEAGGVALALIVSPAMLSAQELSDPETFAILKVVPPNLNLYGNTYGEWSARWWQWAMSVPASKNPIIDTTGVNCAEAQTGPVWFLAGTFGGSATRKCTVPRGKALLFPVLCTLFGHGVGDCSSPNDCDPNVIRKAAAPGVDNPSTLIARIDGQSVPLLKQFRVTSPTFNMFLPPPPSVGIPSNLPSGAYGPVVSDGYFVLVRPLSPGPHTIYFKGVSSGGFVVEVTYHLTVQ